MARLLRPPGSGADWTVYATARYSRISRSASSMSKITVGILGLGTVGSGVVKLLANDTRFRIKWVAVRDKAKARDVDLTSIRVTDQPSDVVNDTEVEIVI